MVLAQSRITAQGQVSLPAAVRQRLGLEPGAMIEWDLEDETLVVRKAGTYSLDDTRRALGFSTPPSRKSLRELKAGLGRYMRATHARR